MFALVSVAVLVWSAAATAAEPEQVLFTNVDVFDGKTDGLTHGMNVLVEGNLIKGYPLLNFSMVPSKPAI